ncbi:MAG: NAD(P)H-binding protein [Gammaproteobacteria bacterium]|nr:NAD(P)H-binding protein [Gammaproteobacteria bacterium]
MRVAVVGGTGFVGSYLTEGLLARGDQPVLLVRPGSEPRVNSRQCEQVAGYVDQPQALEQLLEGADAVIHLVGILREMPSRGVTFEKCQYDSPLHLMRAAEKMGVKRFLLMSANGVKAEGTAYQMTKYRADEALQASALEWTIFRPSVLFGDPRGRMEFATQLYREIISIPAPSPLFYQGLLPLNAGSMAMTPIHVSDVVAVMLASLDRQEMVGKIYPLGGGREVSWKEILKTIAAATHRRFFALPVPVWAIHSVAALLDRFEEFPITRDQLTMLLEGNCCDSEEIFQQLGITPRPFTQEQLDYLNHSA